MTFSALVVVLIAIAFATLFGIVVGMFLLNTNIKKICPELHKEWFERSLEKEHQHASDR